MELEIEIGPYLPGSNLLPFLYFSMFEIWGTCPCLMERFIMWAMIGAMEVAETFGGDIVKASSLVDLQATPLFE